MSDVTNRVLVAGALLIGAIAIAFLQHHGVAAVYWAGIVIVAAMILEFLRCMWRAPQDVMFSIKNTAIFLGFLGILGLDFISIMTVGHRPLLVLMILVIVSMADICAWLFGRIIGGDKMWEKLSANKTWAGQIFGVIGGTIAAIVYRPIFIGDFQMQMVWVGIGIALMSQYGDLMASFVKRRLKIKDFSNLLGKHGGIIDRFDGWILVLPLVWLMLA